MLVHGLQGDVEDFRYLRLELEATTAATQGKVVVHSSRVNTDRTHDGVRAGGDRLAKDVKDVISQYESLKRISFVGFSLGGIYVRYAVALLFDAKSGCVGGLVAGRLAIVAAPNLGVRSFGLYRFLPQAFCGVVNAMFGETGLEMMLLDSERLLCQMAKDGNELLFISALRCFEQRFLYANLRNDAMVNFGTAALQEDVCEVSGEGLARRARRGGGVDQGYDDKGCRICFEFQHAELFEEDKVTDAAVSEEAMMARLLRNVGWKVVVVDFPMAVPIAHNRIMAMSRNVVHTWINAAGRRVVHHLVDNLLDGAYQHRCLFRPN